MCVYSYCCSPLQSNLWIRDMTVNVYILSEINATCMLHSFQGVIKVKLHQN